MGSGIVDHLSKSELQQRDQELSEDNSDKDPENDSSTHLKNGKINGGYDTVEDTHM